MHDGKSKEFIDFDSMTEVGLSSLVIFDWDDTILPTSWLRSGGTV